MANGKAKTATKAKAERRPRPTAQIGGHSAQELLEAGRAGTSNTIEFETDADAVRAAYTLWGLRRRRGWQGEVAVSLSREAKTVTVGPRKAEAMTQQPIPVLEMAERYNKLYTPAIADILDERGLYHQILPPQIQALAPGMRLAGPAQTVKGTPTTVHKDEYLAVAVRGLADMEAGTIAVYDTSNDPGTAHWGELVSTVARLRGCAGAVIDGGVRDVERIIEMGFPVFARYRTPADIRGRWRYVEVGIPIRIGQVLIQPGDFVVGDPNGVVVVPKDLALEVLLEAEKVVEVEDKIREELRAGEDPLKLYAKYGRF